jgi:lysophospholipase L1-like esterase
MDVVTLGAAKADAKKNYVPQANTDLRPFYAALANVASTAVDVLVIGDSIVEGEQASAYSTRWIDRLLAQLRQNFQPANVPGGRGYVPAYYAVAAPTGQGFTYGGVLNTDYSLGTLYGLGRRHVNLLTATGTMTLSFTGTAFDLLYTRNLTSSFTYAVDGGTPVTVAAGAAGHTKVSVTSLGGTTHTLVITQATGTPTIEGVMVYNGDESSGVRLWDGAHYGFTSSSFSSNQSWKDSIADVGPELVIIALGVNDYGTSVASATYKTNLQSIITAVRAMTSTAPILLVADYQRGGGPFAELWSAYVTAMSSIADADSTIALLDLTKHMTDGDSDTLSLLGADHIHPTDKGYQLIAGVVARYLMRDMAGPGNQSAASLDDPFGLGLVLGFSPGVIGTTAAWLTANDGRWARALGGGVISKVGINVGTASGNISVAVYRNSGTGKSAVPAARAATSGAVACPSAGYQEVTLTAPVTVRRGDWLFLSCDNTTATFGMASYGDSGLFNGLAAKAASSHPAPSTAPTVTASTSRWPLLVGIP